MADLRIPCLRQSKPYTGGAIPNTSMNTEIRASKNGARILKQNKFKNEEVKLQYRGILSNKAVVVLKPEQLEVPAHPAPQAGP